MKPKTFEEFLKDCHAASYHGTDDDMPDAFDNWLGTLDGEEYIAFADMFADQIRGEHDFEVKHE